MTRNEKLALLEAFKTTRFEMLATIENFKQKIKVVSAPESEASNEIN